MVFAAGKIAGLAASLDQKVAQDLDLEPLPLSSVNQMDPYYLRNQIAVYDESILFNSLSNHLQSTVRYQYIFQVPVID
jgi:hypothetical protein